MFAHTDPDGDRIEVFETFAHGGGISVEVNRQVVMIDRDRARDLRAALDAYLGDREDSGEVEPEEGPSPEAVVLIDAAKYLVRHALPDGAGYALLDLSAD